MKKKLTTVRWQMKKLILDILGGFFVIIILCILIVLTLYLVACVITLFDPMSCMGLGGYILGGLGLLIWCATIGGIIRETTEINEKTK